ncbi:MAG: tetratricopeptide repeat protein [Chloroflexi bacterium]|nr:tetratricopeptide repeat protein [Chloroflexota bacterium]
MDKKFPLPSLWLVLALTACSIAPLPAGPTATPSVTVTPSVTPSPTPTLTPTPSPTPTPIARVSNGEQALFDGDYELARAEFQAALKESSDAQLRAAALWGLGRVEYADERYPAALTALQQLTTAYPDSPFAAYAFFLTGQAHMAQNHYQEAAAAYAAYLSLRPGLLESYVQELRGDALFADGDYPGALTAYQSALDAPRLDDGLQLDIKIARARAAIGDYAAALSIYDDVASRTNNDFIKAQMDYLAGYAYLMLGQNENAYQRYLHTVENYPLAYDSYVALVELVAAEVPVDDFDRGLVDYFAAQYDVALAAFDRYLAANPQNDGTVHYYRALTLRALDRPLEEIAEWDTLIVNYVDNRYWSNAWDEKAYAQWAYLDNYSAAAQTLLDFVHAAPGHPEAPDFLMSAARILERDDKLDEAAMVWARIADEYPGSELVPRALFLSGIAYYRDQNYAQALTSFQRDLILADKPEDQARAYLWIGKTQQQLGDAAAVQTAWQQAQAIDPTGYYSERARDLLMGNAPFTPPALYYPDADLAAERVEAASWIRVTFNLPAETDLSSPGPLLQDTRLQRGREFWELGLYDEARLEFESLRAAVSESPADSFRLANYLLDLGMYRPAVFAIRQVLTLAGLEDHADSLHVPAYFNHVRYGLYYEDIVTPAAQDNGLHPLFLFSVIRQESLFEGFVSSTAGARGLMQIIPSTGASIARNMGWPFYYKPSDLYRPLVSVTLGAHYLSSNRRLLDGDIYAALAAYNAGPGNALIWKDLGGDDPDLLLEVIRFAETRRYIQYIYETYNIYRTLYGTAPQ